MSIQEITCFDRCKTKAILSAFALFLSIAVPVHGDVLDDTYDLAIVGGRVVDGTGAASRLEDILVRDGLIQYVGVLDMKSIKVDKVIDAAGKVVTPGFVDAHAHGDPLDDDEDFLNFLLQGVTTVILGQDGETPGHYTENPLTLSAWMDAVGSIGTEVNIATLVGHGDLRRAAGVGTEVRPTSNQMEQMKAQLQVGLDAGAFGLSSGLEYVPGRFSETDELVELAKVVGAEDGVVMSHMRSEDSDKIEAAIDELIAQGEHSRVHVSHAKIVFAEDVGEAHGVTEQIRAARNRGISITADVYPFLAGYADLALVYPSWAKTPEMWEEALENRYDELAEYLFDRVNMRNGPESILLTTGEYASMTLQEAADQRGVSFVQMIMDEFDFGGPGAAHFIMREDVQDVFILADDFAISSDGGPWIKHPRSYGSFPKVLEEYVATGRLSLETAIYKMTALPAQAAGLDRRGRIAENHFADIVIFDLESIRNNATWTKFDAPPSGFINVIINGRIASSDGVPSVKKGGKILRRDWENQFNLELLREIKASHSEELQSEGVVGAGVLVAAREGVIGRLNFGYADIESERRVDDDTIFHWASVTKTLTTVAAMQLVERGELSLDTPVVSWLPELIEVHNPYGPIESITVRHLLTHSSGFRSPTWPWKDEPDWQPHEPADWSQLVAMMPYTEIEFEPGSKFGYSNLGTIFLGQIVEKITGDKIETYIDKNIFKPLGMYRSYFDRAPWYLAAQKSHGYFSEGGVTRSIGAEIETGITAANGGLNAPISDMRKFADFLAGNSSGLGVLQPATLAQMFEPVLHVVSDDDRDVSVGLGFFIADNKTPGTGEVVRWVGHSGYQLTHRSTIMVNPSTGQSYVAVANTVRRPGGNPSEVNLRRRLLSEYFPSISLR